MHNDVVVLTTRIGIGSISRAKHFALNNDSVISQIIKKSTCNISTNKE